MTSNRQPRTHTRVTTLVATVGIVLLVAANLLNNLFAPAAYVMTSVAVASALVLLARRTGLTWSDLGLGRAHVRQGLTWAAVLVAGVLVTYLLATQVPATRELFEDQRVAGASLGEVLYMALIRIPLGTVLLEEVAFRGVIYGWIARHWNVRWAVVLSSVLFGLWHILPAQSIETFNPALREGAGNLAISADALNVLAVAGAVVAAAIAGAFLCELRRRSRSLLAPAGLHLATNVIGVLAAAAVVGTF